MGSNSTVPPELFASVLAEVQVILADEETDQSRKKFLTKRLWSYVRDKHGKKVWYKKLYQQVYDKIRSARDEDVPAVKKERKHRFRWGYNQQTGSGKFPFINNANVKEYIFTKRLCIDTPFVGSQSQQNLKWKKLHGVLLEILDGNQKQIFEYLTLQTMKNRFNLYKELTQDWLDNDGGGDVEHSDGSNGDACNDLHRCEYATDNLSKYISYNLKTLMKLLTNAEENPQGSSNKRPAALLTKPSAAAIPLIMDMENVENDSTQVGLQTSSKKMKQSTNAATTTCGESLETTTTTTSTTALTQKEKPSASLHPSGVSNTTTPIDRSMGQLDTIQNWNVSAAAAATTTTAGGGGSTNDQLAKFGTNILCGITKPHRVSGVFDTPEQAALADKTACEDIKMDSDGSGSGNSSRHQSTTIVSLTSPSPSPSLQSRSEITNAAKGKTLQQQLLDLKTELQDYQMTLHAVKQDEKDTNQRLQQEIIYLEDENKKLRKSNVALQEDNKVLFNVTQEQQATIAKNQRLQQENVALEDANEKLQSDCRTLNTSLSDLQAEYSALRQSNVTLQKEKTALYNETLEQKAKIATNRRLQQEKVVLEDANENLKLDARTLNDAMSNLQREHSALQQSNATLRQKHSTFLASYDILQRNHKELKVANKRINQKFENQRIILEKEMGTNEFRLTKINETVTALQKFQVELQATEENLSLSYDTLVQEQVNK